MMKNWIKDIYKQVLKNESSVDDLAAFPSTYTDHFVILVGGWKESEWLDKRYMDIQDYVNAQNGKKKADQAT